MVKIRKIRHGLMDPVRKIFHGNFCSQKGVFNYFKIICLLPSCFDIFTNIFAMANKISCQCLRTTVMIHSRVLNGFISPILRIIIKLLTIEQVSNKTITLTDL